VGDVETGLWCERGAFTAPSGPVLIECYSECRRCSLPASHSVADDLQRRKCLSILLAWECCSFVVTGAESERYRLWAPACTVALHLPPPSGQEKTVSRSECVISARGRDMTQVYQIPGTNPFSSGYVDDIPVLPKWPGCIDVGAGMVDHRNDIEAESGSLPDSANDSSWVFRPPWHNGRMTGVIGVRDRARV